VCQALNIAASRAAAATKPPQYFASWYHDDPFYNKRVGFGWELPVKECSDVSGAVVCRFTFDSAIHSEFGVDDATDGFFGPLDRIAAGIAEIDGGGPGHVPVWPISRREESRGHKFWFTTEVHSHFEYRGDEEFHFSGDDDVWVFLNGRLAVDLGGVHGEREASIRLRDLEQELDLVPGGVYTFDLFHAERHMDLSNFKLTTSLVETCNVLVSGTVALSVGETTSPTESASGRLAFRGGAHLGSSGIVLVDPTARYESPFVFDMQQYNVGSGFLADFTFVVGSAAQSDGFAFVLHQRPEGLDNMPMSIGRNLGFAHLTHSLAVVFDLCAEANCSTQEVRIHFPQVPEQSNSPRESSTRRVSERLSHWRAGDHVKVSIQYLERPDIFEVYIDDSLYLRQAGINLQDVLGGGRNAFIGFTSGTDTAPAWVNITSWSVSTVSIDASRSALVALERSSPADAVERAQPADGKSPASVLVETFDACSKSLHFGGSGDLLRGWFIQSLQRDEAGAPLAYGPGELGLAPSVVAAEIRDLGDGTYAAELRTATLGEFDLYLCSGRDCNVTVVLENAAAVQPGRLGPLQAGLGPAIAPTGLGHVQAGRALVQVARGELSPGSPAGSRLLVRERAVLMVEPPARPEATQQALPGSPDRDSRTWIAGAVLVPALVLALAVGTRAGILRKRWVRDRNFIAEGREARLNRQVSLRGESALSSATRRVQDTRVEVLRERAACERGVVATDLRREHHELAEGLRSEKLRHQVRRDLSAEATEAQSASAKGAGKVRHMFMPGAVADPPI